MANSPLQPPSPDQRKIAAERFERANQVVAGGNFDYAISLLLTCCKLDPGNLLFRQTLRRTQKAKYKNNLRGSRLAWLFTSRARTRLKTAKLGRDYLRVLEVGEEILAKNPWDLGVQLDMAEAFDQLGLLDLAIYTLDQARQKYDKDVTLNRSLARLFEKRGNFAQAIYLWGLVREVAPGDVEAAHKAKDLAASETIKRGQYEKGDGSSQSHTPLAPKGGVPGGTPLAPSKAERVKREAAPLLARLENEPTDPVPYLQLAQLYRKNSMTERAREILQQGLSATGSDFRILLETMELDLEPFRRDLALTEQRIRKLGEAAEAEPADEESDEEPTSIDELRRIRAKLLKEINSREIEIYRLRADRYPTDLGHRLDLGQRLLKADQVDEAITELQQSRKDPRLVWRASMLLGYCFRKRNNWRLAERNFEEALAQVPATEEGHRKEILFQLAQGAAEAGDLSKAIELGHDLANLDFSFRDIGRLLDEWQTRLQQA
jgi:tetratricopeptide (TPR) repeat protein